MRELGSAAASEVAALIAAREVSAEEVTREALSRIERINPVINAFIRIDADGALSSARRLDAWQAAGYPLGPFHGVPMAHKDMFYRAGRVSTCGSDVRRDFVPSVTSTLLQRLDKAGAIDIGTLNMTEFAFGPTGHNAVWGDCCNPWNPAYITGGSSSGSGAAVAAGLVPASLGSDSGGSVRLPAGMCGVVGIKPTLGRLSLFGAMGMSHSIDTAGPLARSVLDCARMLGVMAGHDPADGRTSQRGVPDYEAEVRKGLEQGLEGLRIGIPTGYFYEHCTDEIQRLMGSSLDVLVNRGARLVDVLVPNCQHMMELSRAILYPEASSQHARWLRECPERYSPQIRVRAATGFAVPATLYLEAQRQRGRLLSEFVDAVFGNCDVLHTPLLSFPVPSRAETDVGSEMAMWKTIGLICHNTAPFNYLGLPAMAVPAGFTSNGLPAAMQLVAAPFAEGILFRVAGAFEPATVAARKLPVVSTD